MKHQTFWVFFVFGAIVGLVVGFMKTEVATWLAVGAFLGFLVGLFFENKAVRETVRPEELMWLGFFMLFPIIFFDDYLEGSFWYDVFGILAVIGSFTVVVNFTKVVRKWSGKGKKGKKKKAKGKKKK